MPSKEILRQKEKKVEEMGKIFRSNGVYLFDYRGLSVAQMEGFRNKVKELGAQVKVIKNRLAIKYFERENLEQGRDIFEGPMAIAYADENFVEVAKLITEFEKENDKVEIKAGFIEQNFADREQIKAVAKLPSKDQLLAQVAFSIAYPLKKMGMALTAPLRDTLILLNNLKDKKEKEEK